MHWRDSPAAVCHVLPCPPLHPPQTCRGSCSYGRLQTVSASAQPSSQSSVDAIALDELQLDGEAGLDQVLSVVTASRTEVLQLPTWRTLASSVLQPPVDELDLWAPKLHPGLVGRLDGFLHGSLKLLPKLETPGDFCTLLRLCCAAGHVPSKEWLAAVIYADSGGFERLYLQVCGAWCNDPACRRSSCEGLSDAAACALAGGRRQHHQSW